LESDSTSTALLTFSYPSLVPFLLRNRWHNARTLGIHIISSHIFREGNSCADRLANLGHAISGSVWLDSLPLEVHLKTKKMYRSYSLAFFLQYFVHLFNTKKMHRSYLLVFFC